MNKTVINIITPAPQPVNVNAVSPVTEIVEVIAQETVSPVNVIVETPAPMPVHINVEEEIKVFKINVIAVGEKGDKGPPGNLERVFIAGENITSHVPLALINNKVYVMRNTIPAHQFAFVGFSKTSGVPDGEITVAQELLSLTGWNLTPGQHYLAGPTGKLITTNSTPGSFTRVVGLAEDANTLLIIRHYTPINLN